MTTFADFKPKGGVRNPRIVYRVDDPRMAPLEEMRRLGGLGSMNALYLEALLIGATAILSREGVVLPPLRVPAPSPSLISDPVVMPHVDSSYQPNSPSLAVTQASQDPERISSSNQVDARPVGIPPLQEPRLGRAGGSPAAAAAQFARFGDAD